KFDPIPTTDYYALAGIFDSTQTVYGQLLHRRDLSGWSLRPLGPDGVRLYAEWKAYDDKLDALKKQRVKRQTELADLKKKAKAGADEANEPEAAEQESATLEQTLKALAAEIKQLSDKPPPKPPLAMAVSDRAEVADTWVRVRGDAHRRGAIVPRGFVRAVGQGARSKIPTHESGRLELAEWLVDPANPLTARRAPHP